MASFIMWLPKERLRMIISLSSYIELCAKFTPLKKVTSAFQVNAEAEKMKLINNIKAF